MSLCQPSAGHLRDPGGTDRVLPRGTGRVQVPQAHRGPARPAEDTDRQAAPARTAPAGRRVVTA